MKDLLLNWQETIVALATPIGNSALGIIRISGPESWSIVDKLIQQNKIVQAKPNSIKYRKLYFNNQKLDEVILCLYKSPHSYTGEDMVEINGHGSMIVLQSIIKALIESGGRLAHPGEFTMRAFLHKKIDLTQAEAISDLIHCQSNLAQHIALNNLKGGLTMELKIVKDKLLEFSSLLELELDFTEDNDVFVNRQELFKSLNVLKSKLEKLKTSFSYNQALKEGVGVAIIGKPNTGKSTLLNSLVEENKAIVSELAGTTRDIIEDRLVIDGCLFRIMDTAGLRNNSEDPIEKLGIERSIVAYNKADIVLWVIEPKAELNWELKNQLSHFQQKKIIIVINKMDINPDFFIGETIFDKPIVYISAKTNEGLLLLKNKILLHSGFDVLKEENVLVINERHRTLIQKTILCLEEIEADFNKQIPIDCITVHLKQALVYLGSITGELGPEDQLDYIFSKFCIGK